MTEPLPPVGLLLGSLVAPAEIPGLARRAEELGFGELWLSEDYFYTAGVSAAAVALAVTRRLPVGLGVVSAFARHPSLLAMEAATLDAMYPGRFRPGIGLGFPDWIAQMGYQPRSQLAAIRACVEAVRGLLAGDEVTAEGPDFTLRGVKLVHPPAQAPPIFTGVVGPKMLALSGEVADGTVLGCMSSPAYIRWARERIAEGQVRAAGDRRHARHRLPTLAFCSVAEDGDVARDRLRPVLAFYLSLLETGVGRAYSDAVGVTDELVELARRGGPALIAEQMPDDWLDAFAVVGTPQECITSIRRLLDAGADSVVLMPLPPEHSAEVLELAGAQIIPGLSAARNPA